MRRIAYYDMENSILYYCEKGQGDIEDGTNLVNCHGCPNLKIKKIILWEDSKFKDNGEWDDED